MGETFRKERQNQRVEREIQEGNEKREERQKSKKFLRKQNVPPIPQPPKDSPNTDIVLKSFSNLSASERSKLNQIQNIS